jgi:rubredoxin
MPGEPFECQRCGAELDPALFDRSGWVVRYAFEDCKALAVCPTCQRPDEREIAAIAQHDD